jgi:hypothetical protein
MFDISTSELILFLQDTIIKDNNNNVNKFDFILII